MFRTILLGLFFFGLVNAYADELKPRNQSLVGGLSVNQRLNDDVSYSWTTIKPFLSYKASSEKFRTTALIAVLYNRIENAWIINKKYELIGGFETLITIAGDEPRVDGISLDAYNFKGHRFDTYLGAGYRNTDLSLYGKFFYDLKIYNFYSVSSNASFVRPGNFLEHGPAVLLQYNGGNSPSEILDSGLRSTLYATYKWRGHQRPWGAAVFTLDADKFLKASWGFVENYKFSEKVTGVVKAQVSYVSSVDRLNAIKDGNLFQEGLGLLVSDIRADRAATFEAGPRFKLPTNYKFFLRPFVHGITYREITPTRFRNDTGYGTGLKAMGMSGSKLFWEVTYANLFGNRADIKSLHEMSARLTYSWF
ncbi:MAG: hypothetical protein J0L93_00860 [Deltaproteobacteria bacterium]|nr:hypothetical protein [Deltaproteobacteria bacterium]